MSSFTKSLFRLTVVTFIFAMLMPVTTTRAGPPINGCHPHKEECGDDPPDVSKYTVNISGDLTSVGVHDDWSVTTSGHRSIDGQSHPFDMTLDLRFFAALPRDPSSSLCFGNPIAAPPTPILGASITKKNIKGGFKQARADFWFEGRNDSGQFLHYLLTIFGAFDNPDNWPSTDTLRFAEWAITTASGAGDAAQGACISEGLFDNPETEVIEAVVTIDVLSHADAH